MSSGRRATVGTVYGGSNVTRFLSKCMESFSYTDVASGESDSIALSLMDGAWSQGWFPGKGDRIANVCLFTNWEAEGDSWILNCGNFEVDDISISGKPRTLTIGGTSIPMEQAFNAEERTKTWEDVTLQEVGMEIAARSGIALYYDAGSIPIKAKEQNEQTDCKFLYSLCQQYGLAMKVFYDRIIIFDETAYEARASVATLSERDFINNWNFNTTLSGTYTGAKLSYSDPGTGKDHMVEVGIGPRILKINKEADSAEDARKKALAELNNANKKTTIFSGTVRARKDLVAGACITLTDFGVPDGKYYLDKVVTKVTGKGASQQSITAHYVGGRAVDGIISLDPIAKQELKGPYTDYMAAKGDTLWTIAQEHLGNHLRYQEIYEMNKETIETEAQARGKEDSGNGHWIFPGTVLKLPPKEQEQAEEGQDERDDT